MKQVNNMLIDFKDLCPTDISIHGNMTSVDSCLDFSDISKAFAFCHVVSTVGYVVRFKKEQIVMNDGDAEKNKLLVIYHFIQANRDTSEKEEV